MRVAVEWQWRSRPHSFQLTRFGFETLCSLTKISLACNQQYLHDLYINLLFGTARTSSFLKRSGGALVEDESCNRDASVCEREDRLRWLSAPVGGGVVLMGKAAGKLA